MKFVDHLNLEFDETTNMITSPKKMITSFETYLILYISFLLENELK